MGKIVISENVSLDGVVQDPTGEEGFRHGGRFNQLGGPGPRRVGRGDKKPVRLIDTKTLGEGLAFLTYEVPR